METVEKKHTYNTRSGAVQEILSRPPAWIIRWGTTLVFFFLIILIGIAFMVPSPTIVSTRLRIEELPAYDSLHFPGYDTSFAGVTDLKQEDFGNIKAGQKVLIQLDAYNYHTFGMLEGKIAAVSEKFSGPQGHFTVWISLPAQGTTSRGYNIQYKPAMIGAADIIIRQQKLIEKLNPF